MSHDELTPIFIGGQKPAAEAHGSSSYSKPIKYDRGTPSGVRPELDPRRW